MAMKAKMVQKPNVTIRSARKMAINTANKYGTEGRAPYRLLHAGALPCELFMYVNRWLHACKYEPMHIVRRAMSAPLLVWKSEH